MYGDNLSNRLGSHGERIVGLAESIEHGQFWVDLTQTFVVDHKQGIDVLLHLFHTIESLIDLTIALETEGNSDDTNGKDAQLLRYSGNDGCSTCASTTSHTSGDEGHTGTIGKHSTNVLDALLSGQTSLFWFIACTKAFLA